MKNTGFKILCLLTVNDIPRNLRYDFKIIVTLHQGVLRKNGEFYELRYMYICQAIVGGTLYSKNNFKIHIYKIPSRMIKFSNNMTTLILLIQKLTPIKLDMSDAINVSPLPPSVIPAARQIFYKLLVSCTMLYSGDRGR